MADDQHLAWLAEGASAWNARRAAEPFGPDLAGAELAGAELAGLDLSEANLRAADLRGANLSRTRLVGADLGQADLRGARLKDADLSDAALEGADARTLEDGDRSRPTDLRSAGLTREQLLGIDGDAGTLWPGGVDPSEGPAPADGVEEPVAPDDPAAAVDAVAPAPCDRDPTLPPSLAAEEVMLSAVAPRVVSPRAAFRVRAALHAPMQADRAGELLGASDAPAKPFGDGMSDAFSEAGRRVSIEIQAPGFALGGVAQDASDRLGDPYVADFSLTAPRLSFWRRSSDHVLTLRAIVDGAPVGRLAFAVTVASGARGETRRVDGVRQRDG